MFSRCWVNALRHLEIIRPRFETIIARGLEQYVGFSQYEIWTLFIWTGILRTYYWRNKSKNGRVNIDTFPMKLRFSFSLSLTQSWGISDPRTEPHWVVFANKIFAAIYCPNIFGRVFRDNFPLKVKFTELNLHFLSRVTSIILFLFYFYHRIFS